MLRLQEKVCATEDTMTGTLNLSQLQLTALNLRKLATDLQSGLLTRTPHETVAGYLHDHAETLERMLSVRVHVDSVRLNTRIG